MTRPLQAPPLSPTPTSWAVGRATNSDGTPYVVLSIYGVSGEQHVFFDPLGTKEIIAALQTQVDGLLQAL